jgi:hypothetical protein
MDDATLDTLRRLLTERSVVSLAVLVEDEPVIGLLPFVPTADFSALVVQASGLARHTRGLAEGLPFDALVHAPDTPETDPLQLVRVTLRGHVALLPRDGPAYAEDAQAYVARFPSAATTLGLGDFRLYRLGIEGGRLVAGFGRAFNLSREILGRLGA